MVKNRSNFEQHFICFSDFTSFGNKLVAKHIFILFMYTNIHVNNVNNDTGAH